MKKCWCKFLSALTLPGCALKDVEVPQEKKTMWWCN